MDEEEIQFGDVQFDQPDVSVRPDQDDHFAVAVCGQLPEMDLPIFVDLDVMRDMEAHAQSDKTVELGGVLLGRQSIDDQGQPFVVVTDWLQADHYESTRSRFKFTHETWAEITKRRGGYPNDTEMVGWYHTHPGWGIFLSDMDMFICKNFFNRPLDVALVIDPCNLKRGWFQWTDESGTHTREVAGFYLTTSRHRKSELEYFADLYNGVLTMSDPRYSEPTRSGGGASPIINIADRRNPMFDIAVLGMLFMQFALLVLIAWRMMVPQTAANSDADLARVEATRLQYQKEGYQLALKDVVDPEGQSSEMLDRAMKRFDATEVENRRLAANQDAQVVYSQELKANLDRVSESLKNTRVAKDSLQEDYKKTRTVLDEKVSRIKELEKAVKAGVDPDAGNWRFDLASNWWWACLGCIVVGLVSVFGTLYYVKSQVDNDMDDSGDGSVEPVEAEVEPPVASDENINFS